MKDQSIVTAVIAYGFAIVALCWFCRPRGGYTDFIVGNKSSGWLITAFGLFTLIGGGELVAGASFGHVFGWAGIALFVGYGMSFVLLALLGPHVLSNAAPGTVTFVDYAHQKYGRTVGGLVLLSHLFPFFALLVLQLSAGGVVISQLSSLSYFGSVLLCALLVCTYLVIGGFRAVMVTDLVQGVVMGFLIIVAVYAVYGFLSPGTQQPSSVGFEAADFDTFWGVMISGIVIGLASADVWQRIFASKSAVAARIGFIIGGVVLAAYGGLIVYLGIQSKLTGLTTDPESAYLSVLQSALPAPLFGIAIFGTLAAILSTADTEVFVVSSLLERGHRQWIKKKSPWAEEESKERKFGRGFISAIVALACIAAYWGSDLAVLFHWMFVSYMVFAPTIAASIVFSLDRNVLLLSFVSTAAIFVILLWANIITLDNAYILTLPAIVITLYAKLIRREKVRKLLGTSR